MAQTIVRGRYVVTDPTALPLSGMTADGALLVEGGAIAETGAWPDLGRRYPQARILGSHDHLVIPGLVNAHHHGRGLSGLQLGMRDDYLERWTLDFWRLKPLDVYRDTLYANLKMIRSGVTAVIHSSYARVAGRLEEETQAALRAYRDAGLRVAYAVGIEDELKFVYGDNAGFLASLPEDLARRAAAFSAPPDAATLDRTFAFVAELAAEHRNDPLIRILYGPSWPVWCSNGLLRRVAEESERSNLGIHLHALESPIERDYERRARGKSVVEALDELGLLGPRTSLAHGTWLNDRDIELCAKTGTSVCHNASSNLRLRNGIAPVARLIERGVNVAIGMDSWALASDEDMLAELRLVANLHRLPTGRGLRPCPTPFDVLRMGSLNGARAAGLGPSLGKLEKGGSADLVLLDYARMTFPYIDPDVHPVEALVYLAQARHVDAVMIKGEAVFEGGRFVKHDETALARELAALAASPLSPQAQKLDSLLTELKSYVARYYGAWREESAVEPRYAVNSSI